MLTAIHSLIGWFISPPRRDERGLSQSTENALLLAGAVAVATAVVTAVGLFVASKLAALK